MGTHTNIARVKRFSKALNTSDRHFRNPVDNAFTGVLLNTTLGGKITFVNRALARMLEFDSPEEMQAEGMLPRWRYPELRQKFIYELKQRGYVDSYEMDAVTKTGRIIRALFSTTLQDGEISGMVLNITERKRAEDSDQSLPEQTQGLGVAVDDRRAA